MDVPGYSEFLKERFDTNLLAPSSQGSWGLLMTFREHN
jgi:hypothetical protein